MENKKEENKFSKFMQGWGFIILMLAVVIGVLSGLKLFLSI